MTTQQLASAQPVVVVGARSPGTAALLEFLVGFFAQIWGVGHIYAGRVSTGILIMVSYWVIQLINLALCLVLIGFITLAITPILYAIFSTLGAAHAAEDANRAAVRRTFRAA